MLKFYEAGLVRSFEMGLKMSHFYAIFKMLKIIFLPLKLIEIRAFTNIDLVLQTQLHTRLLNAKAGQNKLLKQKLL